MASLKTTAASEYPDPFRELSQSARSHGIAVQANSRPAMRPQASPIDLVNDPYILFLGAPFYVWFVEWCGKEIKKLWQRFFGKDRVPIHFVNAKGIIPHEFAPFSIVAPFRHGHVVLKFRTDCPPDEFERAVDALLELVAAYEKGETYDGIDLDNEDDCYANRVIIVYDDSKRKLQVLNPLARMGLAKNVIEGQRKLEKQRRRIEPTVGKTNS